MLILFNDNRDQEIRYNYIIFNGGEGHVTIIDKHFLSNVYGKEIVFYAWIQSFNDLGKLLLLVDAVKRLKDKDINLTLRIHYFPGARQDRVSNAGEALTVKVYADIINSLGFDKIEVADPHSDITPALINNCILYPIENVLKKVVTDCKPDLIIIPDGGATKRIEKYMLKIRCDLPQIQCLKKRDTKTGKLTGFKVCASQDELKDKKCLIVDDICDAGGTFIGLCEALDALDASDTFLYITHGIFSKGYTDLLKNFKKIYTTDSFIPKQFTPEGVKVYNLY